MARMLTQVPLPLLPGDAAEIAPGVGVAAGGLPRVFRTGNLRLVYAAACILRYSSWASCGVLYPSAE